MLRQTLAVFMLCTLLSAKSLSAAVVTAPPYHEVSKKLDDLYRSTTAVGKMELISTTETQTRHLKMRFWSKGKDKTLIIIDEPAREAGIATLKVGNNIWNFLPKISRTIRIPPSMMLSAWMGTDLTNDDLVKESSYEDDFEAGPGQVSSDPAGWLYVMKVKPGIIGRWSKIDWVVASKSLLPLQAKYYDRKGQLARIMRFSDVKIVGGKEIPTLMSLESIDQPGHHTQVRYLEIKFDTPLSDSKFSLSELERK